MSGITFGNLRLEFTVGDSNSVIVTVRAKLTDIADLDKLSDALAACRDLLPASADGRPKAGDATEIAAPLASGAVDGGAADSETPKGSSHA